ncbi:hypothetical protein EVAR_28252_1 [Eumeta japonica]|uniref:Uncharacterized protein n=1 Tax=Eumeta variegata TaxID=151549 RepID=A0A4C1V5L9_EUMVA|nr:hypothetical protein EVAR_28252_1 [Eumeta japonica]
MLWLSWFSRTRLSKESKDGKLTSHPPPFTTHSDIDDDDSPPDIARKSAPTRPAGVCARDAIIVGAVPENDMDGKETTSNIGEETGQQESRAGHGSEVRVECSRVASEQKGSVRRNDKRQIDPAVSAKSEKPETLQTHLSFRLISPLTHYLDTRIFLEKILVFFLATYIRYLNGRFDQKEIDWSGKRRAATFCGRCTLNERNDLE